MLLRWKDFNDNFKPEMIANELTLVSDTLGVGGTIDNVSFIEHNGERKLWLIDYKSSNMIHDIAEFQLSAYAEMWNEKNPEYQIDRCGILHLKAQTRGRDKTGKKIQGEKWQLYEFPRHYKEALVIFKHIKAIWDEVNPNPKPLNLTLPDRL
jgi:predicted lipase